MTIYRLCSTLLYCQFYGAVSVNGNMTGKRRITKDSDVRGRRLTDTVPQNKSRKTDGTAETLSRDVPFLAEILTWNLQNKSIEQCFPTSLPQRNP